MPLLNKHEHNVDLGVPAGLKDTAKVFVIPGTGEIVRSYEEYVTKFNLYCKRQWQDKYTRQGGLTFHEALDIEQRVAGQLSLIPHHVRASIARQVHESSCKLEDLISNIHSVISSSSPSSDKENGSNAPKAPVPVSKRLLRIFIGQVAARDKTLWRLRDAAADQYGLPRHAWSTPGAGASPAKATKAPEGTGAAAGEGAPAPRAPLTLEQAAAAVRPGTLREAAFKALRELGPGGASVEAVQQHCITAGIKTDWPESGRKALAQLLSKDTALFARVAKGRYALAGLPGVVHIPGDALPGGRPPLPAKGEPPAAAATAAAAADGAGAEGGVGASQAAPPAEGQDTLAALEQQLAAAQSTVAARRRKLEAAKEALAAAKEAARAAGKAGGSATKRAAPGSPGAAAKPATAPASPAQAAVVPGGGSSSPGPALSPVGGAGSPGGGGAPPSLPPHLVEYSGDPNDRKALMAWKKEREDAEKKLEIRMQAWCQQQRLAAAKARAAATADADAAVRKAEAALATALRAEAEARRGVERVRQREALRGAKDEERAGREAARLAEKDERERRRAEALAARRYPLDDGEHLGELLLAAVGGAGGGEAAAAAAPPPLDLLGAAQVAPAWRPAAEGAELAAALYVADTVSCFRAQLGLRCGGLTLEVLTGHLRAAGGSPGDSASQAWLSDLYTQLLQVLLSDLEEREQWGRREARWAAALAAPGAWPEVLRAALTSWDSALGGTLLEPAAVSALSTLRAGGPGALSPWQHLLLLTVLLDEVLDTERVRGVLAARLEGAAEAAAELRGELLEARRGLRELTEAERAAKKAKKAEALASQVAAAMERAGSSTAAAPAAAAAAAAGEGEAAAAAGAGTESGPPTKKARKGTSTAAAGDTGPGGDEEQEPDWSLPPELQEYTGDPSDTKARSAWRKQKQEAEKQLEKKQAKWKAAAAARAKAAAEAARKAAEEERGREAAKRKLEEQIAGLHEALEREMERHALRRTPLGTDRHGRAYWWGLAGHKGSLLLQQDGAALEAAYTRLTEVAAGAAGPGGVPRAVSSALQSWREGVAAVEGCAGCDEGWGELGDPAALEALAAACDGRGVREKELKAALERELPAMAKALKKVATQREVVDADAAAAERIARLPPPRALPSRAARAAAEQEIKRTSATAAAAAAVEAPSQLPAAKPGTGGWAAEALSSLSASLVEVAAAAAAAKAPAPLGGWVAWRGAADALGQAARGTSLAALDGGWQEAAEELLAAATGGGQGLGAEPASGRTLMTAVSGAEARAAAAAGWCAGGGADAGAGQVGLAARLHLLQLEQLVVEGTGELPILGGADKGSEEEEQGEGEGSEEVAAGAGKGAAAPQAKPAAAAGASKKRPRSADQAANGAEQEERGGDSGVESDAGRRPAHGGKRRRQQQPHQKKKKQQQEQEEEEEQEGGGGGVGHSAGATGTTGSTPRKLWTMGRKAAGAKGRGGDKATGAAAGRSPSSSGGQGQAGSAGEEEGEEREEVAPPSASRRRALHGPAAGGPATPGQAAALPEEDVWSDGETELPASRLPSCCWRAAEERAAWRACVAAATTPAQLAYAAAVLAYQAAQPLAQLKKRAAGAGNKKRR